MLKQMLNRAGHEVTGVVDGQEALDVVLAQQAANHQYALLGAAPAFSLIASQVRRHDSGHQHACASVLLAVVFGSLVRLGAANAWR